MMGQAAAVLIQHIHKKSASCTISYTLFVSHKKGYWKLPGDFPISKHHHHYSVYPHQTNSTGTQCCYPAVTWKSVQIVVLTSAWDSYKCIS